MSTVKSKNLQVGTDATATNNFTIYQPSTPDGTLRIGVGNADSPTEVAQFTSAGMVSGATSLTTASGSAPSYSGRAWVNFNGEGVVAIRDSGNVSSITDIAVGRFGINFAVAMPDTNYAFSGSSGNYGTTTTVGRDVNPDGTYSTTRLDIRTTADSQVYDDSVVNVIIFR